MWQKGGVSHQMFAGEQDWARITVLVYWSEVPPGKDKGTVLLRKRWIAGWSGLALLLMVTASGVSGHAILKESSPAANGKVSGPTVPITLKYNVRVDAKLSKLQLLNPDNATTDLQIDAQSSPNTLNAQANGLKPGAYRLRWQVLAPDGHITRGEIPFTVTAF